MSVDITTLEIRADSRQVGEAQTELQKLVNTATGVDRAVTRMGDNLKHAADSAGVFAEAFRQGEQVTRSMMTPLEKYEESLQNLSNLLALGAISQDTYNRSISAADSELASLTGATAEAERVQAEYNRVMAEGRRVAEELRTPAEKYKDTIANLDNLLKQGAISQGTYNRALKKAKTDLQEAERAADKWKGQMVGLGLAAGAAAVGGLALVSRELMRAANNMDDVAKASQKLGISVQGLQEIRYAAELSGVSTERLDQNFVFLNKSISENSKAFAAMGISARDANGQLLNAEQVLPQIADRFASYADGASKTALAQEIFGRSAADIIPLLNAGSAGLAEMASEANALGVVFGDDAAVGAEVFNDNLTRLNKLKDGLFIQVANELLPSFMRLTDAFVALAKDGGALSKMAQGLASILKFTTATGLGLYFAGKTLADYFSTQLALAINTVVTYFTTLKNVFGAVAEAFMKAAKGDFAGAWQALTGGAKDAWGSIVTGAKNAVGIATDGAKDIAENIKAAMGSITSLYGEGSGSLDGYAKSARIAGGVIAPVVSGTEKLSGAQRELNEHLREGDSIYRAMMTPLEKYSAEIENLFMLRANSAISDETLKRAIKKADMDYESATKSPDSSSEYGRLVSGLLTEEEEIHASYARREIDILTSVALTEEQKTDLITRLTIDRNQKLAAIEKANHDAQVSMYQSTFGSIAEASASFGGKQTVFYKAMFGASKAFALADSILKIQQGLAASASVGFPLNVATIAGHLASTAGIIASIKGTTFAGAFDNGGNIPSGKWGIVGEYGPEIVHGPASVTSRKDTAKALSIDGKQTTATFIFNDASGNLVESVRAKIRSHEFDIVVDELMDRARERANV